MNLSDLRPAVQAGTGLVANYGKALLLILDAGPAAGPFADEVTRVVETAAARPDADVGRGLVRELAAVITRTPAEQWSPFGVVADAGDGLAVLLVGAVELYVSPVDGPAQSYSGADAAMWLDRIVHEELVALRLVGTAGRDGTADPRSHLRLGAMSGAGLTCTAAVAEPATGPGVGEPVDVAPQEAVVPEPASEPEPAPEPVPEVGADVADEVVETSPFGRHAQTGPTPEPSGQTGPTPEPAAQTGPTPEPAAQTGPTPEPAAQTGPTPEPAEGEPPADSSGRLLTVVLDRPAGQRAALPLRGDEEPESAAEPVPPRRARRLIVSDGTRVDLDRDVLVGREPSRAAQVTSGAMQPLTLGDTAKMLSRVHASFSASDGVLTVEDLGSTNGTRVARPGETRWTRLEPHEPITLEAGSRVLLGDTELVYDVDEPDVEVAEVEVAEVEVAQAEPAVLPVAEAGARQSPPGVGGIADYVFLERLGTGDRGTYYLAETPARLDLAADRVVVKVFGGGTSDDAFRRAARELRAFAAAESPYLIAVHDAGQDHGLLFYSMDYISGGSLHSPGRQLEHDDILRYVAQAARAAHALHEVGVVHQGIKPRHILLGDEHAYLSDLGIAQVLSPVQEVTSVGTLDELEFLDPALLTGGRGTRATDLWSLAATLHYALTGVPFFDDLPAEPLLRIRAILTQPPGLNPLLRPDEAEIIRECLHEKPADRLPTTLAFAERIEALLPPSS